MLFGIYAASVVCSSFPAVGGYSVHIIYLLLLQRSHPCVVKGINFNCISQDSQGISSRGMVLR